MKTLPDVRCDDGECGHGLGRDHHRGRQQPVAGRRFYESRHHQHEPPASGAALGSSDWFYNNVRNNGVVGVRTTVPYDGDGSVWFNLTQGPSGNSSKADIEYYDVVGGEAQSLGTLGNLTSLSYSWYREAGGTASNWLMPLLRLYVQSPDGTKSGYLCFDAHLPDRLLGPSRSHRSVGDRQHRGRQLSPLVDRQPPQRRHLLQQQHRP